MLFKYFLWGWVHLIICSTSFGVIASDTDALDVTNHPSHDAATPSARDQIQQRLLPHMKELAEGASLELEEQFCEQFLKVIADIKALTPQLFFTSLPEHQKNLTDTLLKQKHSCQQLAKAPRESRLQHKKRQGRCLHQLAGVIEYINRDILLQHYERVQLELWDKRKALLQKQMKHTLGGLK